MVTTVYLTGEPGSGQTSAMGELLATWTVRAPVQLRGALRGQPFGDDAQRVAGLHLGLIKGHASGTEALPSGALGDGILWPGEGRAMPRWVYGEGNRLAHVRFLTAMARRGPVLLVHLVADADVCARRRYAVDTILRRPALEPAVVNVMRARAHRLADAALDTGRVTVVRVDTERLDPAQVAATVRLLAEAL